MRGLELIGTWTADSVTTGAVTAKLQGSIDRAVAGTPGVMGFIAIDTSSAVAGEAISIQPNKDGVSWGSAISMGIGETHIVHDPYNTTTREFAAIDNIGFVVTGAAGTTGTRNVTIRLYVFRIKV
jgi:hypothetical protein